jgi:hypothetical protein
VRKTSASPFVFAATARFFFLTAFFFGAAFFSGFAATSSFFSSFGSAHCAGAAGGTVSAGGGVVVAIVTGALVSMVTGAEPPNVVLLSTASESSTTTKLIIEAITNSFALVLSVTITERLRCGSTCVRSSLASRGAAILTGGIEGIEGIDGLDDAMGLEKPVIVGACGLLARCWIGAGRLFANLPPHRHSSA